MASKSIRVLFKSVRIVWPKLFEADEFQGKTKFSVGCLITRGSDNERILNQAIEKAVIAQFGAADAPKKLRSFKSTGVTKFPVKEWEGDDEGNTLILTPKRDESKGKPTVVDRAKKPIDPSAGIPYAGCVCNISLDVFAHTFQGGGLAFYLNGVQFVEEGPRLGGAGATDCAGDFEMLEPAKDDSFPEEDVPF